MDIVEAIPPCRVLVMEPKIKVDLTRVTDSHHFAFDDTFDHHTSNEQVRGLAGTYLLFGQHKYVTFS